MLSQIRKRASRRGSQSKSNSESEGPSDGARFLDVDPYDLTRSETYRTEERLEDEVRYLEEVKREKEKAGKRRNIMVDLPQIQMSIFNGRHGMLFDKAGNTAFVACNSVGPQYLVYWGEQAGRNVDSVVKQELMSFANTKWHIFKSTGEGEYWIAEARQRERQRAYHMMEAGYYEEIRDPTVKRVHGIPTVSKQVNLGEKDRPVRKGRGRNNKYSEELWETSEHKLEEKDKKTKNSKKLPTDDDIVQKFWGRTLTDYTIPRLTAWMKENMTSAIEINGVEKIPKYIPSMEKQKKWITIDYIEKWLQHKAVYEQDEKWVDLMERYRPEGEELTLVIPEELERLDAEIIIGDEPETGDDDTDKLPAMEGLDTTLSQINKALDVEVDVETAVQEEMEPVASETDPSALRKRIEEQIKKTLLQEKREEKLKEQMVRILADRTKQDHKEDMVEAIEKIRTTGFREDILGLQQRVENMKMELKKEQRNSVEEARKLATMKDTLEALEVEKKKDEAEYKKRLLLAKRGRSSNDTEELEPNQEANKELEGGFEENEEDTEFEEEGYENNYPKGSAVIPATTGGYRPGILKVGGSTLVLDDYEKNLAMRDFTEEPEWWKSVIESFAIDPKTGARAIPPVVKSTAYQVEDPKHRLIQAFKENIGRSTDHHFNLFETAKMMIRLGICHHLLPQIYTDHLIPPQERNLLQSKPEARSSLTALLEYIRKKSHQLTGMEQAQNRAINYYTRELNKKDADLVMATHTLKQHYARDIMRCQANFPKLTSNEREVLKESLARNIMETELKLHYKEAWNKALEMGVTHLPVEELADKMNGVFYVHSKKKRVNTVSRKQAVKNTARGTAERKTTETPKRKRVNNLMERTPQRSVPTDKPFQRSNGEGKPTLRNPKTERPFQNKPSESKFGRTSFQNRKPFPRPQGKTSQGGPNRQSATLTPIAGSPGKSLWTSADGKIKIRLPCRYHEDKGATVKECMSTRPGHCYECSKPGHIAPPIRECKGNHQWKEDRTNTGFGRNRNNRQRI